MRTRSIVVGLSITAAAVLLLLAALALARTVGAQQVEPAPSFTLHRAGIDRFGNWSIDYSHNGGAYLVFACGEARTEAYRWLTHNYPVERNTLAYAAPACPAGEVLSIGFVRWSKTPPLYITEPVWFGPYTLPYVQPNPPTGVSLDYAIFFPMVAP